MSTTLVLYSHPGDASATSTTNAGVRYTAPAGGATMTAMRFRNGPMSIIADNTGYADVIVEQTVPGGTSDEDWPTLTKDQSGTGDVAPGQVIDVKDIAGPDPWPPVSIGAGQTLSVRIEKNVFTSGEPGGPGVKLGPFTIEIDLA